jgi:hypothetical protein
MDAGLEMAKMENGAEPANPDFLEHCELAGVRVAVEPRTGSHPEGSEKVWRPRDDDIGISRWKEGVCERREWNEMEKNGIVIYCHRIKAMASRVRRFMQAVGESWQTWPGSDGDWKATLQAVKLNRKSILFLEIDSCCEYRIKTYDYKICTVGDEKTIVAIQKTSTIVYA